MPNEVYTPTIKSRKPSSRESVIESIQYRLLKKIAPAALTNPDHSGYRDTYDGKSKLAILMGSEFFSKIAGKTVIDFGCGEGSDSVEMAENGAKQVIGIDIRSHDLETARRKAVSRGVQDACAFMSSTSTPADVIVSLDAFEHFGDPAEILEVMSSLLGPAGEVYISFGPTWYHPKGGHLFSIFPWAHLLFSESALIRWRSDFKTDGATRFGEVSGGLNQITIAKFKEFVAGSALKFASIELLPINKLRYLHNRFTREFTTAVVRCRLVKR